MAQLHPLIGHQLQQLLSKGPVIQNTQGEFRGFTQAQLEGMGFKKDLLKKALHDMVCHKIQVIATDKKSGRRTGGFQNFYCVLMAPKQEADTQKVIDDLNAKIAAKEGEEVPMPPMPEQHAPQEVAPNGP